MFHRPAHKMVKQITQQTVTTKHQEIYKSNEVETTSIKNICRIGSYVDRKSKRKTKRKRKKPKKVQELLRKLIIFKN